MADYLFPTTGQRSEYTPGTAEKMRALERRQKIAAALIEQGMQPKQVRQAGRFVVAPSMMEQLSGPLTTLAGVLSSAYLDKEREGIQEAETAKVAKAMQDYAAAQEDVPEWRGRTVPGTGRPEVVGQPSNLEDILQASAPQEPTIQLRKPAAEVADAVFARQQPQQLQVSPEFDGPAAQFATYRPGVLGSAAVPDRRETADEAYERVGGTGTAQGVREGWIDPGPIVRPDLAAAASEANRPDAPSRPRTPAELRAADMALMASGVPNAWPIVHLASQQREADQARAETIAERQENRRTNYELKMTDLKNEERRWLSDREEKIRHNLSTEANDKRIAELREEMTRNTKSHQDAMAAKPTAVHPVTIADPQNPGRSIVIDATTGKTIGGAPKPSDAETAEKNQNVITSALNQAEDILKGVVRGEDGKILKETAPLPTGSGLGSLYDASAAFFGKTSGSADQAAALRSVAGTITSLMPRFKGADSEADRKYYIQMAGELGDDTLPIPRRLRALTEVRKLHTKHGGVSAPTTDKPDRRRQGWVEKVDAEGNRALVSPDGKQYEELP